MKKANIAKCKKPSAAKNVTWFPLDEALYNTIEPKLKSKKVKSKLQKAKRSEKRDLVPPWMRHARIAVRFLY